MRPETFFDIRRPLSPEAILAVRRKSAQLLLQGCVLVALGLALFTGICHVSWHVNPTSAHGLLGNTDFDIAIIGTLLVAYVGSLYWVFGLDYAMALKPVSAADVGESLPKLLSCPDCMDWLRAVAAKKRLPLRLELQGLADYAEQNCSTPDAQRALTEKGSRKLLSEQGIVFPGKPLAYS